MQVFGSYLLFALAFLMVVILFEIIPRFVKYFTVKTCFVRFIK